MSQPQKPIFRIFKTIELAAKYAGYLRYVKSVKYVPICVRPGTYLVAPEGFSAIERGYGYPTLLASAQDVYREAV